MIELDPSDPQELAFALHMVVRRSGLTLAEIAQLLDKEYGVKLTDSALSHNINRGTIRLQRALQILAVCGVSEVEIKGLR